MTQQLTPAIVDAVNALVEKGAYFTLAMHRVPLAEFGDAEAVRVWTKTDRPHPYLSGHRKVDGYALDLYTADLDVDRLITPQLAEVS